MDHQSALNNTKELYLSGGFKDGDKTVVVTEESVQDVPPLRSNHEEADSQIILHAIYSAASLGASRIVVYANDTDVIVMYIYYANRFVCQHLGKICKRSHPVGHIM